MNRKWGWVVQDIQANYSEVVARGYCIDRDNRTTTEIKWSCYPKEHPELLEILNHLRQYIEARLPELSEEYKMEFTE